MATIAVSSVSTGASSAQRRLSVPRLRAVMGGRLTLPLVLLAALVSHAYHLFSYPNYTGDEGIYMEQAWSVLKGVGLSPYTYFYDHAPGGWIMIAAWLRLLPGGVLQWGTAINSGRVFILLLGLASTALLFRLAQRLSGSEASAALTAIVFALSPLSFYYGRMVLLDNIMVFWVLLALELLTNGRTLFALLASGLVFGIAILTKENAVYFTPIMVYLLYNNAHKSHFFPFGVVGWIYLLFAIVSFYPLFALLKGELFGTDAFLLQARGGNVNLLGAVQWQMGRSDPQGSIFNYPHGTFWSTVFTTWASKDPIILAAGMTATAFNVVVGVLRRDVRHAYLVAAALALLFAFYLVRGAVLLEFYILPLLPFLALNIGLAAHLLVQPLRWPLLIAKWRAWRRAAPAVLSSLTIALGIYFVALEPTGRDLFTVQQTGLEAAQIAYIRDHIPCNDVIMISDDIYVDLHEQVGGRCHFFPRADSHFKISSDPAVDQRLGINNGNWRAIKWVIVSYGLAYNLAHATNDYHKVAWNAYLHSAPVWQQRERGGVVSVEIRKVVASEPVGVGGTTHPVPAGHHTPAAAPSTSATRPTPPIRARQPRYWFDVCVTRCPARHPPSTARTTQFGWFTGRLRAKRVAH